MEEVDKLVASYRNTPHSVTGKKPSKLMFNHVIDTKLPRFPSVSRRRHHQEARKRDEIAKTLITERCDVKHRTILVEMKPED